MLFRSENPILGPDTQVIWNDGTLHYLAGDFSTTGQTSTFSVAPTLNTATQTTFRAIDAEPVITSAVTSVSGNVAAVRGNITQNASGTLGAQSFLYGVQGKLTLKGTLVQGSGFAAGVFGQVDTSASGFVHTSGYLAPIMGDFGATSIMTSDANANMITVLNTTNCIINAGFKFIGNASYAFDLTDLNYGGAHFVRPTTTVSSMTGSIAVLINGAVRYIPVYTS
jgi:hypothetical protein